VQQGFDGTAGPRPGQVIGRGDLLSRARGQLMQGGSLLLYGPAGIGKSTLLRTLSAESADQGQTVLRCAPTESESQLPFLAMVDLFGLVADEVADALPAPQRAALESALTGRTESSEQRDGLALRLAVLSVLRALAAKSPVLVVADDLQWMDPASAELLAFAARRIGGLPVRVLGAVRTDTEPEQAQDRFLRAFPPQPLTLCVPPLSGPQMSELLTASGRPALPRAVLRDVHRTSGGNPLFALELGRALVEAGTPHRPGEPLPVPTSLRTLVLNRLDMLSADTRSTLLVASAGARPTLDLLRSAGRPNAGAEISVAAALGLVEMDTASGDAVVRFAHPLISAALYAAAQPQDRCSAHAALAAAASDPIERARHLALATPGRDARVADGLAEAAAVARGRGAPAVAAQLGLLAARHTPAGAAHTVNERRLDAAEDALLAGETELARATAREVLADATLPGDRVRAWMVVIDSVGQALADVDEAFPQALADAGDDPRLLGLVHSQLAWRHFLVDGDLPRARAEAAQAARLAARAGDRRTELLALAFQAHQETMLGHPDAPVTLERALSEPQDPEVAVDHNGPVYVRFRYLLMSDELDAARATIAPLVREAGRRGAVESETFFGRMLAETELRAGRCGAALELALESLRLAQDTGIGESPALLITSLAEAAGGSTERALALAKEAAARADGDGDLPYLSRTLYALGHAHLVAGDAQAAVEALRRVREAERELGVAEPARGRWQGDLAEALVAIGEFDEAQDVIDATRESATRLRRASVLAVLDRAQGVLLAARGEPDRAAETLRSARDRLSALGYRVEEGRTHLALAQVERRRRNHAGARSALDTAVRVFRTAKAQPWLGRADAERRPPAAVSAAAPPSFDLGELAAMEHRVAALVLEGATNREIAAALFISVKTVEATLTRVYRKLGVRSRVDVVRLAAGRRAG
jgi:DNA-binding CsgD family transcriptional regulator/energy-coupling factor transporter ATP-binding protein EcfA2